MFNFPLTKSTQQRKDRQTLQNSDEKQILSVLDHRFSCFYYISCKQRMVVEILYVS